jgi:hypothetical protein
VAISRQDFSQIVAQHQVGRSGWGASEHLRGDLEGTRLYTHSAFSISGFSADAAAARQAKWAAGATYVKQAIDREFGVGMGERVFAKVSADTGRNLNREVRRGDLAQIKTAIAELRNPATMLLAIPDLRLIDDTEAGRPVQRAVIEVMTGIIDSRLATEAGKGRKGLSPDATLGALRQEIMSDPRPDRILKAKALSVIDMALAQNAVERDMAISPSFSRLPPGEAWRLVLDGRHQETRGKTGFENEQGYMAGMLSGLSLMMQTLRWERPLDADLFQTLHDTCTNKVYSKGVMVEDVPREGHLKQGFRTDDGSNVGVGFSLKPARLTGEPPRYTGGTTTPEGRAELDAKIARDPWFHIEQVGDGERLWCVTKSAAQCAARVDGIFDAYRTEIGRARTEDDKLRAIARCCQDLDQSHVFEDGNIRTVAFLVMNKLLAENGLSPAILDEPNCFDGFSVDQLVGEIRAGQATFQARLLPG